MTVEELIIEGKKHIHKDSAKMLLASLLKTDPLDLYNHLNDIVEQSIEKKYHEGIQALKNNKPIQYVIGTVNFYGEPFKVNRHVLIPRFETEELVENTIKYIDKYFKNGAKVIDLGCGSGVIGLTLKKQRPNLEVTLLDISKEALQVTTDNAQNLNITDVNIQIGDMLENIEACYDIIISNPPYIKTNEPIDRIVKENEPSIALYGGENGLDYYKRILDKVDSHTNNNYLLAFEIGSSQKDEVIELINNYLKDVQIIAKKDLQGRDRMIFVLHNLV